MEIQNRQQINYYTQNETANSFKCDLCALKFRNPSELSTHILSHFQNENCSICNETIIQLGNIWYIIREHPDHTVNKTETNSNHDECRIESIIVDPLKKEADPIDIEQTEIQSEQHFTALDDDDVLIKTETHDINHQTDPIPDIEENLPDTTDESDTQDTPMLDDCATNNDETVVPKIKTKRQCHICMKKYVSSSSLKYHMNVHLGIKPYACKFCDKAFAARQAWVVHERMHARLPTGYINNHKQNKNTAQSKLDEEHTGQSQNAVGSDRIPNKTVGICDICNSEFTHRSSLLYHMKKHMQAKPFECSVCNKKFVDKRNFNNHRKTHVKPSEVMDTDDNDLEVFLSIELDKFKLTPKQLKSLTCPICCRKFLGAAGLKGHLQVHRTPMYQCKLCIISFTTIDRYRVHKLAQHTVTEYSIKEFNGDENDIATRETENTDWLCEYCNADFKLEINLAKHILKDHDEKKTEHVCNICVEKFNGLSELLTHMRAHPESTQYKCTYDGCEHGFAYKAKVAIHLNKHKLINGPVIRKTQDDVRAVMLQQATIRSGAIPDEDTTCNICSKKFPNRTLVQQHIRTAHQNERIKCVSDGCDKIFKTKPGLVSHVQINHPELIRECETCKKVFFSDAKLAEHQKQHESGLFACNLCPKTFTMKHRLLSHMNSHEKEAKCDVCNEKFSTVKGMLAHRERHGKHLKITCRFPGCDKIFENRREFMAHASQHPENEKLNKAICPYCGKSMTKGHIKDHMNIHTGETPYECSICKKSFAKHGSLRRHHLIHTGARPYVCDVDGCSQAYRESIDLKRHKFSAHQIYTKKHICSICTKVFSERKLLRNHITKVHDKVDPKTILNTN